MGHAPYSTQSKGRVAIVGLGIIGGSIARHLQQSGWNVAGFDIAREARQAASDDGIAILTELAWITDHADLIFTSLPSAHAARSVIGSIARQATRDTVIVELSTLGLPDKMDLATLVTDSRCTILDCPISGTGAQAAMKDIAIYASGDEGALERAAPALACFSRSVIRLGPFGQGSTMKLVANLLVAIHNVASAEAMTLGTAAGLDPDAIIAAIEAGAGNSRIFELRAPMMARRTYQPATMKLDVWLKDLEAISALAKAAGSPTPLLDASRPAYALAAARMPDWDTAAVFEAMNEPAAPRTGDKADG